MTLKGPVWGTTNVSLVMGGGGVFCFTEQNSKFGDRASCIRKTEGRLWAQWLFFACYTVVISHSRK